MSKTVDTNIIYKDTANLTNELQPYWWDRVDITTVIYKRTIEYRNLLFIKKHKTIYDIVQYIPYTDGLLYSEQKANDLMKMYGNKYKIKAEKFLTKYKKEHNCNL